MESDSLHVFTLLGPADIARLGGIPADAVVGVLVRGAAAAPDAFTPDTFKPNPTFVQLLHEVIHRCAHEIPGLQAEAQHIGEGYVYVLDGRTTTPQDGVPPEDIVGYVRAERGRVVPGSYQPNANHRIVTARGLFRLPTELHDRLLDAMRSLPSDTAR